MNEVVVGDDFQLMSYVIYLLQVLTNFPSSRGLLAAIFEAKVFMNDTVEHENTKKLRIDHLFEKHN